MRQRFRHRIAVAMVLFAAIHSVASADTSPELTCPELDHQGHSFSSMKALPRQIIEALARKMPGPVPGTPSMADRDEAWQVTDVIMPGPRLPERHFVRGGSVGQRWYIWYETGGIARYTSVAIFELAGDGSVAKPVARVIAPRQSLCSTTHDHLADPIPQPEQEHDVW